MQVNKNQNRGVMGGSLLVAWEVGGGRKEIKKFLQKFSSQEWQASKQVKGRISKEETVINH